MAIQYRRRLGSWLDSHRRGKTLARRFHATTARLRGGHEQVIRFAESSDGDLPALEVAQLFEWAVSLSGRRSAPRYLRPTAVLPPELRKELAETSRLTARAVDPHLRRQLLALSAESDMEGSIGAIEDEFPVWLDQLRPTRPARHSPDEQLAAIDAVSAALDVAGEHPFLMSGTLLGVIRDGAPMPHDVDIDLGLLPDATPLRDLLPIIQNALPRHRVQHACGRIIVWTDTDLKVEIFEHIRSESDDRIWHGTDIHRWWNSPFSVIERNVLGHRVLVPTDFEKYLTENYGPTWHRPARFFDSSFDTPNGEFHHNPAALSFLLLRAMTAHELRDRWTFERACDALRDTFDLAVGDPS